MSVKKVGKKQTPKKRLSERDKKTVKAYLKGKPFYKAMESAGYKKSTAKGKCAEKKKELAPTIQALMEKRGLTDDRLLKVLEDGLESTKVISCNIIANDGEGMKDADSMTKDFVDVPDFAVRHKYMETGLKLKGHMKQDEDKNQSITVIIKTI